jgi:inositol-phosphate transport system substrate-binding protein
MMSLPHHLRHFILTLLCCAFIVLITACLRQPGSTPTLCPPTPTPSPADTEIVVWAVSSSRNCWYHHAAVVAAQRLPAHDLQVRLTGGDIVNSIAIRQLFDQLAAGAGPDLAHLDIATMAQLQEDGYLVPLDDCVQHYPHFGGIRDEWWPLVTIDGQIWGIPFDSEVTLFFYNKTMLRELGWTNAEINALSQQIQQGNFSMPDVLQTAQEAIARGIVQPGFGYWPHTNRTRDLEDGYLISDNVADPEYGDFLLDAVALREVYDFQRQLGTAGVMPESVVGRLTNNWSSRLVYRDTIVAGRVLFWRLNLSEVARIWSHYPLTAEQFLEMFGAATLPSFRSGQSGTVHLSHTVFVVPAEQATGRRQQTVVCQLLPHLIADDIGAHHATTSFRLSAAARAEAEPVLAQHPFLPQVETLLNAGFDSQYLQTADAFHYHTILTTYMLLAESGELTPDAAVEAAIAELRETFGKRLLVER